MSAASRKSYVAVFAVLIVLTLAELGVVYVPGISKTMLISALTLLALGKAGLVLMSYMHLGSETRALKLGVILPFLLPAIYAAVLAAEAAWRLL